MIVYPHCIRNRSQWNALWRDNQPHGYSRPILFQHSTKRMPYSRQNHHDCRQNLPWLLWNVLLTTPYVKSHYKYMFLVARGLYEMFVLYRGKHAIRSSTVGIWNEVRVYRAPVHEHIVGRRPTVGQVSRQPALDVFVKEWMFYSCYSSLCFIPRNQGCKQAPQFADHWAQSALHCYSCIISL